jgi:hypothetical protein
MHVCPAVVVLVVAPCSSKEFSTSPALTILSFSSVPSFLLVIYVLQIGADGWVAGLCTSVAVTGVAAAAAAVAAVAAAVAAAIVV